VGGDLDEGRAEPNLRLSRWLKEKEKWEKEPYKNCIITTRDDSEVEMVGSITLKKIPKIPKISEG